MKPIIVIALLTAVCLIGDSMLYIVLPTHWQEAGLSSLWEVGVLLSINRLIRLPLNPIVGWLYKKISTRQGVLLAAALAFATTLSYGFVKGFLPLLLIRCVWGLAWTFLRLGSYVAIVDCSTDLNRGHSMGMFNGLYRLGSFVGMLAGGFIADYYGLYMTALLFGAITLLSIPSALLWVPTSTDKRTSGEENTSNKSVLWKNRMILRALLTGMLVAMIFQGMFTATLSYLVQAHNSAIINIAGFTLGATSLAGILQAIRWGWEPWLAPWVGKISDGRYGRGMVLIASLLLAICLFALLPLDIPIIPWLLIVIGIQLAATALTTITDAIASDAASSSSKLLVLTAYSIAIDFGAAMGPFLGYLLNTFVQAYAAYWGAVGTLLLLTFAWLATGKAARRIIFLKS
ncbi:MFS transporter [Heliobacterium gestii]|uniref:MFS transporter n=1 Tax=Heliomicrobium gestii TaxID=2699 RepID=A0A845LCB7_HELGE|nr:MFS transporter [Heliomicrobium gestii]MBM7868276.1 MFS family permease [Heliomicrobium gestii]MZP44467.1 MFS transporter [Heliomicrobium gestii]